MINKQSFIKGTIILMCANAISKILGAVFKIPLTYLLAEEGMAIYNTAFNVYIMLLSFIISGMPLAISKMIAEESALENWANVKKITMVSTLLLGGLGLAGSALLWFGADFFAIAMKEAKAVFCLKIIAPSIFFVALGTVYKSFYQGRANMTPTALSQVIEAVIKLAAGYALALYYAKLSVEYTAAAAIMGVTVGEIIATFILFVLYLPQRFRLSGKRATKSSKSILNAISMMAIPAIIASVIASAMNLVDITVIRRCLENIQFTSDTAENFLRLYASHTSIFDNLLETLRISSDGSRWLYGAYSGYALTVFHLPIGILGALGISILPVIAGALAVNHKERANLCVLVAAKLTLLIALPAAFVLALFSEPILGLLFKNTASAGMLQLLSPCLIFLSVAQLMNAVSNAGGKIVEPLIFGFIGAAIKLAGNYIFIQNPHINMLGTVLSANLAYFTVMILSCFSVRKQFSLSGNLMKILIKPLFCAAFMAGIMYTVYTPFLVIFAGEIPALIGCAAVGAVAYGLMLLCTKCITKDDLQMLKGHS